MEWMDEEWPNRAQDGMKTLWKMLCSYKRAEEQTNMEFHATIMERNEIMTAKEQAATDGMV